MKLLRLGLVTVMLLSSLFILGCGGASQPCDYGTFADGTYTNSYFNLKIDVPESWYVMDDEDKKALFEEHIDATAEALFGDTPQKSVYAAGAKKEIEAEYWRWGNINLLNTSKYWPGLTLEFNPNLIISTHELAEFAYNWSGRDVLNSIKLIFEGEGVTCSEIYEQRIDGALFHVLEATNDIEGLQVTTRRYSTVQNKYELRIELIYGYDDQDSLQELEAILDTMRMQP